jgi:hypothetical protein
VGRGTPVDARPRRDRQHLAHGGGLGVTLVGAGLGRHQRVPGGAQAGLHGGTTFDEGVDLVGVGPAEDPPGAVLEREPVVLLVTPIRLDLPEAGHGLAVLAQLVDVVNSHVVGPRAQLVGEPGGVRAVLDLENLRQGRGISGRGRSPVHDVAHAVVDEPRTEVVLVDPPRRCGIQLARDEHRQGEPPKDSLGRPTPLSLVGPDLDELADERQAGRHRRRAHSPGGRAPAGCWSRCCSHVPAGRRSHPAGWRSRVRRPEPRCSRRCAVGGRTLARR